MKLSGDINLDDGVLHVEIDDIDMDDLLEGQNGETPEPEPEPEKTGARDMVVELTGNTDFMAGLSHRSTADMRTQKVYPDIFYRYLCAGYGSAGWRGWNSPDGAYVDKVINAAAERGAVPMFTYYQLALELEQKNHAIFTSDNLGQYLNDLKKMFERIAAYDDEVIVQLEPDFFGYLQIQKIDLETPVSLNYSEFEAYPKNIIGLMRGIVAMGKKIAPKVKIGYHVSKWAKWFDINNLDYDHTPNANSVADFLLRLGAADTDFITLEMSDRDAGFYEVQGKKNVYWNDDVYANYFSWAKKVIDRIGLPGLLWQIPLGVPSPSFGVDGRYRDNRVSYLFSHIDELINAGFFGMVFGAGKSNQTTISTDNGQFQRASREYMENRVEIP